MGIEKVLDYQINPTQHGLLLVSFRYFEIVTKSD
jgi:hypothetical protein